MTMYETTLGLSIYACRRTAEAWEAAVATAQPVNRRGKREKAAGKHMLVALLSLLSL